MCHQAKWPALMSINGQGLGSGAPPVSPGRPGRLQGQEAQWPGLSRMYQSHGQRDPTRKKGSDKTDVKSEFYEFDPVCLPVVMP